MSVEELTPEGMARRQALGLFTATVGLVGILNGCGDNTPGTSATDSTSSSGEPEALLPPEPIDETLEQMKALLRDGQYEGAITVLESYRGEDGKKIAARNLLLSEAYCDRMQGIIKEGYWEKKEEILGLNTRIKSLLAGAEALGSAYGDEKWRFYLIKEGKCPDVRDASTLHNALRTLLYSVVTRSEEHLAEVFDVERERERLRILTKIELSRLEGVGPQGLTPMSALELVVGEEVWKKYTENHPGDKQLLYDGVRNWILGRIEKIEQMGCWDLAPCSSLKEGIEAQGGAVDMLFFKQGERDGTIVMIDKGTENETEVTVGPVGELVKAMRRGGKWQFENIERRSGPYLGY